MEAPPPRFSTTNCWPASSLARCARMRATMSLLPPGPYGTMMRTVRFGNPPPCARAVAAGSVAAAASRCRRCMAALSLQPHIGDARHLAPLRDLAPDKGAELLRRGRCGDAADI